jgi:hypothetical protein
VLIARTLMSRQIKMSKAEGESEGVAARMYFWGCELGPSVDDLIAAD